MKALILNGLAKEDDPLYELIHGELKNTCWEGSGIYLHDKHIAPCQGCFGCWINTPGICVIEDDGREVIKEAVQSDLMVFLTPVTFGGYSSDLKRALDRLMQTVLPFFVKINGEFHHRQRYPRRPCLIGLGVLSKPDEEGELIFKALVARNALNLQSPSSAGGVVIRDDPPEKIRREVNTLFAEIGTTR
jgi:hypothetical protein